MKQVKISNFFARNPGRGNAEEAAAKRKREDEGETSGNASRRARLEETHKARSKALERSAGKRRKGAKGGKSRATDKENGCGVTHFSLPSPSAKRDVLVLSPKKLTENVVVGGPEAVDGAPAGGSPRTTTANRELKFDLSDSLLDDLVFDIEEEEKKEEEEDAWLSESELKFDVAVRCEVVRFAAKREPRCEQAVLLRGEGSDKRGVCKLRDVWTFLTLNIGDVVTVKAVLSDGEWVVNAKKGFVVTNPDALISITSLAASVYCLRKGVLANSFRGVESGGRQMLVGRLVHEVFQEALRRELTSEEEVAAVADEMARSKSNLRDMYLADVAFEDVWLEVSSFVPRIVRFVDVYVAGRRAPSGNNFRGRITEIVDIEELVSSAKIGMQGRVDMTVRVEKEDGGTKAVKPLELKTGRASFSREHRIQVIAYSLLLDETPSRGVDSGLLLYLRDGIVEEVARDPDEIRNLLLLRNEFARHARNDEPTWPEPIRSSSCAKCPFARVCTAFVRRDGLDRLSPNHPIREIQFPDVSPAHVEYFASWTKMSFLEYGGDGGARKGGESEELYLTDDVTGVGDEFRHVFRRGRGRTDRLLRPGAFVSIGTATQPLVARGKLTEVSEEFCSVHLDKRLSGDAGRAYKMDVSSSNLLTTSLANLARFMDEPYRRLREIVAEKKSSVAEEKIEKKLLTEDCLNILKSLNREQQRAVLKAVAAKECMLIRGPPGTGKTETIVALVKVLLLQNQTVLVTGHTHSSVDNILTRLGNVDYVRFGSAERADEKVRSRCFATLADECSTLEDVKRLYECRVAASTCLGLDVGLLARKKYDVCLMDESSQVTQVEAIRPLLMCRKFVLIGDSNQLPPVVKNPEAKRMGMDESIFERLEGRATTASLRLQYRMNRVLNDLANALTYGGELECGGRSVAEASLALELGDGVPRWIREILSPDASKSVVFVDTSEYFDREERESSGPGLCNSLEASLVESLIARLAESGIAEEDIGVMSPYCGQVDLMKSRLGGRVDVSTVDQFQGRDKDVILFSCARHDRANATEESRHVLGDKRRLTVAVTRARVKLVILGDAKSVEKYAPVRKLLSVLNESQVFRLRDGDNDFRWSQFQNNSNAT